MAQIGKVQAITGTVTARTPEGQVRELKAGDMVSENEIVETAAGSTLSIIQEDGNIVSLGAKDQLLLDESVTSNIDPRDAVIQEVAELQEAIVKTLEEGGDIDDITDEPAAGALAGDHDFQTDFHAGDAAKGDVGTYLLDPDSDQRDFEYTQYRGDEPDAEVVEPVQIATTPQSPSSPTVTAPAPPDNDPTIDPENDPPVAINDSGNTAEDMPVTIDVTANDTDLDGTIDPTTVVITKQPTHGTLTVDPVTGQVTYTPEPDYNGDDSFQYTVEDDTGAVSNVATVKLTIDPENDPPVAINDSGNTAEDTPVTIDVTANDTDLDGTIDSTTVVITTQPTHGTLTVDPVTGQVTYTPEPDYNGDDSFQYTVEDDTGAVSNVATVKLTIDPENDPPVAVDDFKIVDEDSFLYVSSVDGVLNNDSDIDGDTLTVIKINNNESSVNNQITLASGALLTLNTDGSYSYDTNDQFDWLATGETTTDSFTYTVSDGNGEEASAIVTITINGIDDAPMATDDSINIIEDMSNTSNLYSMSIDDFGTYSDADGDALTAIRINTLPTNGDLLLNGVAVSDNQIITVGDINNGYLQFDLVDDTDADSSFEFSVNDGDLWSTGSYTTAIEIEALADMPIVDITAENTFVQEINTSNVLQTDLGFTIEAFDARGNSANLSDNSSPAGFGVAGGASGANSELGYNNATSTSESIVVTFDEAISYVNVSFSWMNSSETAGYTFYDDGEIVGYGTEAYGSDKVDPAVRLQPGSDVLFDQIVFDAPAKGDDYLINSISFERTETVDTSLTVNEHEAVELDINTALTDTDGSEELTLTLDGMPAGSVLSDAVNSVTSTGEADAIDITGWDLTGLTMTPQLSDVGDATLELTVTASATETSNVNSASATDTISINVNALVDASPEVNPSEAPSQIVQFMAPLTVGADVLDSSNLPVGQIIAKSTDTSPSFDQVFGSNDSIQPTVGQSEEPADAKTATDSVTPESVAGSGTGLISDTVSVEYTANLNTGDEIIDSSVIIEHT